MTIDQLKSAAKQIELSIIKQKDRAIENDDLSELACMHLMVLAALGLRLRGGPLTAIENVVVLSGEALAGGLLGDLSDSRSEPEWSERERG